MAFWKLFSLQERSHQVSLFSVVSQISKQNSALGIGTALPIQNRTNLKYV